jgi:hypothetical protein
MNLVEIAKQYQAAPASVKGHYTSIGSGCGSVFCIGGTVHLHEKDGTVFVGEAYENWNGLGEAILKITPKGKVLYAVSMWNPYVRRNQGSWEHWQTAEQRDAIASIDEIERMRIKAVQEAEQAYVNKLEEALGLTRSTLVIKGHPQEVVVGKVYGKEFSIQPGCDWHKLFDGSLINLAPNERDVSAKEGSSACIRQAYERAGIPFSGGEWTLEEFLSLPIP